MLESDYQNKPGKSIPGFPKKWTFGFQLLCLLFYLGQLVPEHILAIRI